MIFKEIRRGDPDPAPNQLHPKRNWWLDFNGKGFTIHDQINGTMNRQWRMPPSETGAGVGSLVEHLDLPGVPALEDYVARYCERRDLGGIPDLDTYLDYNFFRMAAIFQGIVGRVRDGTAANARAAEMADLVGPMADVAWDYAKKAGA